jgi:hypothetical protein
MNTKMNNSREVTAMSFKFLAVVAALVLAACTGTETPPYQTSTLYGPANGMPTFWITYPTESDTHICLDRADNTFPAYWVMYNPPTGARVRFKLDRHLSGGGTVVGPVGCSGATCLATTSPTRINMTGQAVGEHLLEGEIVNADGTALTTTVPCDPQDSSITCPIQSHKFFVNFTTRARALNADGGQVDARCPALDGGP